MMISLPPVEEEIPIALLAENPVEGLLPTGRQSQQNVHL